MNMGPLSNSNVSHISILQYTKFVGGRNHAESAWVGSIATLFDIIFSALNCKVFIDIVIDHLISLRDKRGALLPVI